MTTTTIVKSYKPSSYGIFSFNRINVVDVDAVHSSAPSTFPNVSTCATIIPPGPASPTGFALPMFNFIGATPTPSHHDDAAKQHDDQKSEQHEPVEPPTETKPALDKTSEPKDQLLTVASVAGANYRSQTVPPDHGSVLQRYLNLSATYCNSE